MAATREAPRLTRVVSGFGWLAGANIISQAIGLLTLIYVSRRTTAGQLGAYSLCAALNNYFGLAVNFGVTMLAIRDRVRTPERQREIFGEALVLQLVISIATLAVVVALVPVLAPGPLVQKLLPIVALRLVIDAVSFDWALQAQQRFKLLAAVRIAGQVVYAVGIFALVTRGEAAIVTYVWSNLIGFAVIAVGTHLCVGRGAWSLLAARPRALLGRWRRSLPVGGLLVAGYVYSTLDYVMLGYLAPRNEVGLYAVAYRFPEAVIFLSTVWANTLYPHAAELAVTDPRRLARQVGGAGLVSLAVGLPMIVMSAAVGPDLLGTFFGAPYHAAGTGFALLMVCAVALLLATNFANVLIAAGHERTILVSNSLGVVVNAVIDLVLIPPLGLVGAAIGTTVAALGLIALNGWFFVRRVGPPSVPWRPVAAILVATAVSVLVPVLWHGPWVGLALATLLAYVGAAGVALGGIRALSPGRLLP